MAETFVQVRFDEQALRRVESAVAGIPNAMNRIVPPSLNRTATWVRARMARSVAQELGTKVNPTRKGISIDRASASKWQATVRIFDARYPLARFAEAPAAVGLGAPRSAGGVTYILPAGKSGTLAHGFWARMPSGHVGIFQRAKYVKAGVTSRRERRSRVTNVQHRELMPALVTRRTWWTELPIRESFAYLHEVISLAWLPALRDAAGGQLVKEIRSRVQWQLDRFLRRRAG